MMKTASTKRNINNNTTPQYDSHMAKRTSTAKTASLVPNSATRWHLFCKYFFTPEINNQMKQTKATIMYRNYPVTPLKEDPNLQGKPSQK
jgi:hypothetical protein